MSAINTVLREFAWEYILASIVYFVPFIFFTEGSCLEFFLQQSLGGSAAGNMLLPEPMMTQFPHACIRHQTPIC